MNELQWVDFLRQKIKPPKDVLVGIGDDCAFVKLDDKQALLKSDLFIENIHFDLKKISFKAVGMRAVGRVLSDFAACGGVPKFIGVSAGVPEYVKDRNLKDILEGIFTYSKKYKFSLVGGDTSRSEKLFLDVWGVGAAKKCVLRSTAKVGDFIFLTGKLGERKFNLPFEPRIKESQVLVRDFKINAMIDISDGFIIDLYRLLKESKKGAVIYKDSLPLFKGESDLYRGEDYELIFTVDSKEEKIEALKKEFYLVGKIKAKSFGCKALTGDRLSVMEIKGYTHF